MDTETYKKALNCYDSQILEMENTIRNIRNEIAETEEAKENAKGIRNDFERFVERKKEEIANKSKENLSNRFRVLLQRPQIF